MYGHDCEERAPSAAARRFISWTSLYSVVKNLPFVARLRLSYNTDTRRGPARTHGPSR